MYNYVLHPPDKVDEYADAINAIGKTVNESNFAETIKKACHNEQAFFFACEKCFFVLRPMVTGMLVWVAASSSAVQRNEIQQKIEELTRDIGLDAVEFWSIRPGFNKVAIVLGYSRRPDIWHGHPITVWRKSL